MRLWVVIFVHVFVVVQLVLPLSYYVSRSDPHDERFAWRMFSPVRMLKCQPAFTVGAARTPVQLGASFHEAWIELARRGRVQVIEAMARELCRRNPGEAVRVELRCTRITGERYTQGGAWDVCTVGSM
jgi:hypothetical protein